MNRRAAKCMSYGLFTRVQYPGTVPGHGFHHFEIFYYKFVVLLLSYVLSIV